MCSQYYITFFQVEHESHPGPSHYPSPSLSSTQLAPLKVVPYERKGNLVQGNLGKEKRLYIYLGDQLLPQLRSFYSKFGTINSMVVKVIPPNGRVGILAYVLAEGVCFC